MEEKSGAQISKKAFIQSVIILLVIMLVAGVLTRVIPAGAYERLMLLIVLGLTVVGYPKWLRWTLPLWGVIVLITLAFLALGVAIGYGPF